MLMHLTKKKKQSCILTFLAISLRFVFRDDDFRFELVIHNSFKENLIHEKTGYPVSNKKPFNSAWNWDGWRLHRSKLQICIEILCSLVSKGSSKLSQISDEVALDKARLIPYLRLLRNRGLINKQNLGEKRVFYVVTERGLKVLKVINPIIKEAYRIQIQNLQTISSILSTAKFWHRQRRETEKED